MLLKDTVMFIETGTRRDKKIKISFDQNTEVFCKKYRDTINLEEIKESWMYCIDHSLIPNNCIGILLDYRETRFDMSPHEIIELVDFYNNNMEKVKQKKIAILTDRPDQIVIPTLLSQKAKRFKIQVFTSMGASISWVRIN